MRIRWRTSFRPLLWVAGLYLVIAAALFVRIPVSVPAPDIFDQVAPSIPPPAPKTEAQPPAATSDVTLDQSTAVPLHLVWEDYVFVWQIRPGITVRWKSLLANQFLLAAVVLIALLGARFATYLPRVPLVLFGLRKGICIWIAATALTALVTFPPWIAKFPRPASFAWTRSLGNAPLWRQPPAPNQLAWNVMIDYERLLLEIVAAESVAVALYLTWGNKAKRAG